MGVNTTTDEETKATLARVAEVTRLSLGRARVPLREQVRQSEDGWRMPTTKNGHHPAGLFDVEADDPRRAADALRFSGPEPLIEMNEVERMAMFRRAFRAQSASLQDWTHYRIRAAWRIVREMASISGIVNDDEKLIDMMETKPDPWLVGGTCPQPDAQDPRVSQMWGVVERMTGLEGMPLLPPQVPAQYRDEYGVKSEYNPTDFDCDPRLHYYLELVSFIAAVLRIEEGSNADTEQGIKGMEGLEDPYIARLAWPSRLQIVTLEDHVVCEALDWMIEKSNAHARKMLATNYGLQGHEIKRVMRMALAEAAARIANGSVEEERGLMVLRLEKIEEKALDVGELRVALGASKQAAIVLGLNKVDPQDILKEFVDIVRDRGRRREKAPKIEAKQVKALVVDTSPSGS